MDASDIINIIYDNETAKYTVFWKYVIVEDQDDVPHGNLIDKDELISQFNEKILENMPVPRENMYSLLRECVDNAPIVLERSKK